MNAFTKRLLIRLGVAGIIILLLLAGMEYYFKSSKNPEVVKHFKQGLEYTNEYQFDKAINEYNTILNMKEASKDDKDLARVMEKIVEALKKSPANTALLDQLNELSRKANVVSKKDIENAKTKGAASPFRSLEMEKQRILKELATLNKVDTSKLNSKQKSALEEKRMALLEELRHILDQQQNGQGNVLSDATKYYKDRIAALEKQRREQQELLRRQQLALKRSSANKQAYQKKLAALNAQKKKLAEINARKNAVALQQEKTRQQQALDAQKKQEELKKQQELDAQNKEKLHQQQLKDAQQKALDAQKQAELAKQQALENQNNEKARIAALEAQHQKDLADAALKANQSKINALKNQAKMDFSKENYDKAMQSLVQAGSLAPNDGDINALKAIIALRQNNQALANEELAKATTHDKGEASISLAKGEMAYARGDMATAGREYQNSVQKENNALANYRLGTIALKAGNPSLASTYYTKAYESPDKDLLEKNIHVKLTYNMGQTNQRLNNNSKAIAMYKESSKLDPSYVNSSIALAQVYYNQKDYHNAVASLYVAYTHDPKNTYTLSLLGKAYHNLGRNEQAVNYFQKLVDLTPNDASALYNLGSTQISTKDFTLAAKNLNKSLSLKQDNNTKAQLGIAYLGLKQYSDAESLFKSVLAVSPNDVSSLKGMGESSSAQNNFTGANTYLQKAYALAPNDEDVLYKLGYVNFELKDLPSSINYFLKAYNVNPSANNAYSLANTYLSHNELDNALNYYNIALKKEKNPLYSEGEANVYIKKKEFVKARDLLQDISKKNPHYQFIGRVNRKIMDLNKLLATMARFGKGTGNQSDSTTQAAA